MALRVDGICLPLRLLPGGKLNFFIALSTSHDFVSDRSYKLNFSECDIALTHMENYQMLLVSFVQDQ